ncbi:hypothetical protein [Novosphingobium sp.]|uniref:hypothetical protein n=1 Tax=Novosphingobium sp. TaxID=1874826 RepID=UPI0028B17346|nr:hypothetical protein [Novosphingobium sp.]
MPIYAGLDVSDKATHVCVVDVEGAVLRREMMARVRIPRSSRAAFRFEGARDSEMIARSVPRIVRAAFRDDRAQFAVGST